MSAQIEGGERLLSPSPVDAESEWQYPTALNHLARKFLYNAYAEPPIGWVEGANEFYGIDGEIVNALKLSGNETLVDVGCGDGNFIQLLSETCGHKGTLIGVNNSAAHYLSIESELADKPNVYFMEEDARKLPIEDEIADCVTLKFVAYHIDQPERAINEALRILKPGGSLLIATRNPGNQGRMWGFMADITEELKIMTQNQETTPLGFGLNGEVVDRMDYSTTSPPETFYRRFDMDRAKSEMLKRGLTITTEYIQSSSLGNANLYLPLTLGQEACEIAWDWYKMAMITLITAFNGTIPSSRDMTIAIAKRVKPVFDAEVAEKGYFAEQVEQGFFVAQKN